MDDIRQFPWASILVLITSLSVLSKIVYDYAATKQILSEMMKKSEWESEKASLKDELLDAGEQRTRQILSDMGIRPKGARNG